MKKLLLLCAVLFFQASPVFAQLIKYVSYYPVPSVMHTQVTVTDKAVLAASDGGVVEVGSADIENSGFATASFSANHVGITSYVSSDGKPNLMLGNDVPTGALNLGSFKTMGLLATKELDPAVAGLEAQGIMELGQLYWPGKGGFGIDAKNQPNWKGCSKGYEMGWRQLKMVGSNMYKTYLLCGRPTEMAEPVCKLQCKPTEKIIGSPARQNCQCVEDCTKRTDGRTQQLGKHCCLKDQILRDSTAGTYCSYIFEETRVSAVAIVDPTVGYDTVIDESNVTCTPNYDTIKFYIGGSRTTGGINVTDKHYQEGVCGGCWENDSVHTNGWSSSISVRACPEPLKGQSVCDAICQGDVKTCSRTTADTYCYTKEQAKPAISNVPSYRYAKCVKGDNCCFVCKHEYNYSGGTVSSSRRCPRIYTSNAVVTKCIGK